MKRERLQWIMLMILAVLVLGANIGGYSLWAPDEPRFGQVAREMLHSHDFLVPRINGDPYKEKPPLLFWLVSAVSWPVGDVTERTARIPAVALGVLTVVMTYWLGSRLYGHTTGIWAGAVLMSCALFFREARSMRTDILLACCTTAFLCAHTAWSDGHRTRWLVAMYAALGAGLLAKGPPALVFPILFLLVFYWRRWDEARGLHPVIGLMAAFAVALAWFIPARMAVAGIADQHATAGVGQEAYRQIIGRLFTGASHPRPPWYYLLNVPVSALPWTLLLPWMIPWTWRNRRDPLARPLLAWIVPAFIFFSLSVGKREMYLLPAYPAMAILIARSAFDLAHDSRQTWQRRTGYVWAFILLAMAVAPFAILATKYRVLWSPGLGLFGGVALLCCIQTLISIRRPSSPGRQVPLYRLIFLHGAALAILTAHFVFPVIDGRKGAREICEPVRQLAERGTAFRLYSVGFTSEEYIYYSKHFRQEVLSIPFDMPEYAGLSRADLEHRQEPLRGAVEKALDRIALAGLLAPTDAERTALTKAIDDAIDTAAKDTLLATAYRKASTAAFAAFAKDFAQPEPAFMYVELRNWKQLALEMPRLAACRILSQSPIGSRTILLVANAAGAALVPAENPDGTAPMAIEAP